MSDQRRSAALTSRGPWSHTTPESPGTRWPPRSKRPLRSAPRRPRPSPGSASPPPASAYGLTPTSAPSASGLFVV
jgi:hypothetical protein